jgi:hypothetical protein
MGGVVNTMPQALDLREVAPVPIVEEAGWALFVISHPH